MRPACEETPAARTVELGLAGVRNRDTANANARHRLIPLRIRTICTLCETFMIKPLQLVWNIEIDELIVKVVRHMS
jgi:hypothetical protein